MAGLFRARLLNTGICVLALSLSAGGAAAQNVETVTGDHGVWPLRHDYRSIFLLSGPDIKPEKLGPLEMVSLDGRLEQAMGLACRK